MAIALLFFLQLATADFDIDKARTVYEEYCKRDGYPRGTFFLANPNVRGTTTKIAAMWWPQWNGKANLAAEDCAVAWLHQMLGDDAVASRVWEELQDRRVRRFVIFHKGLFVYVKKESEMAPELITTYFAIWRFGP